MEGKITVSHVSLPEPDKLTFYTAFLAGYRRRCFDLKMKVMLLHLVAKDEVLRQMENVVWKTGQFPYWSSLPEGDSALRPHGRNLWLYA